MSKKDRSIRVPQRDKLKNNLNIKERNDLTDNQKKFLEIAQSNECKMMFVSGPAGTSKTYLAVLTALRLLNNKKISDILYIRSAVESSDHKLGYLPGESEDKMLPYLQPLIDKLDELLCKLETDILIKEQRVKGQPVGFMRGLNWNAKAIIADEMQNCSFKELVTLMTRAGEFSKVFLLGDPMQSDINGKSGFNQMYNLFNTEEDRKNGVFCFKFTKDDVVRSGLVKYILEKLESAPITK